METLLGVRHAFLPHERLRGRLWWLNQTRAGEGKFRPEKFSKIAKHKVGANVHIRTFPQDVQLKSGKKVFFKFNFLTAFFHQIGMTDKSDAHYIGVFLK